MSKRTAVTLLSVCVTHPPRIRIASAPKTVAWLRKWTSRSRPKGTRMNFKTLKAKAKFGIKERRRYREEGRLNPRDDMIRVPL